MAIIYVPLEEIETRYTKMFNAEIMRCIPPDKVNPLTDVLISNNTEYHITEGEFLGITDTIKHKAGQLKIIAALFNAMVSDGDCFLIPDIFFPGLEGIKYMAELKGIDVKIYAFNHAGRADPTDFVQKLGTWSDWIEFGWHKLCEKVFVGSEFHKKQIEKKFGYPDCMVTGMPFHLEYDGSVKKNKQVIYPHRLSDEKGFKDFQKFVELVAPVPVIVTNGQGRFGKNVFCYQNLKKSMYHRQFATSKYYVNFSKQETYGYTIQEAKVFGCNIYALNNACISEMTEQIYPSVEDIAAAIKADKGSTEIYVEKYNTEKVINEIIHSGAGR